MKQRDRKIYEKKKMMYHSGPVEVPFALSEGAVDFPPLSRPLYQYNWRIGTRCTHRQAQQTFAWQGRISEQWNEMGECQ